MAENIDLAKFNLDTSGLVQDAEKARLKFEELRKEQKELRKEMRDLQKEGKDSGKEYENLNRKLLDVESSVKSVGKEYRSYQAVLGQITNQTKEVQLTQSELDAVLNQEVTTIEQLRNQNTALNQIRNKTNVETEEGRKQLEKINSQLDQNNKKIKKNVDSYTQQKMNIGNYREAVKGAINDLGGLSGALGNSTSAMGIATNMIRGGVQAFQSLTRASLAFITTAPGAVLTILAVAIASVVTALSKSEENTNKLKYALAPLKGLLDVITDAVVMFGEMIINNIIKVIDDVSASFDKLVSGIQKVLKWLGLEEASEGVSNYRNRINEAVESSRELEKLNQRITKESRKLTVETANYKRKLEELKVERDNQQNSLEDRIKANNEINNQIESQLAREEKLLSMRLDAIELEIKEGNKGTEILDKRAQLTAELIDLETKADGERRRMIRRQNRLNNEAQKQASEARKQALDQLSDELELFKVLNNERENSYQEQLEFLEIQADKERELLDKKLKNEEITQTQYNTKIIELERELNESLEDLADDRIEEIADSLSDEVRLYLDRNKDILDSEKLLNDDRLELIKENNQAIFEEQQKALEEQFENELISQKEFDEKLKEYKQEQEEADKEAEAEKEEQEKEERLEKELIEFEEEMERLRELGALREEVELEVLKNSQEAQKAELDRQKEQGIISEELYNARLFKMNQDLNRAEIQAEQAKANQRTKVREQEVQIANQLAGAVTQLMGEQSSIAKGVATAMAMINTFQGFTKALAEGGIAGIAMGAAVLASGIAQVQRIVSTKIPGQDGGGGGGVSTPAISPEASQPNVMIPEDYDNASDSNIQNDLTGDNDSMEKITEAVAEGAERGTKTGSEEGITNLSSNRQIQESSIL